MLVFSNDAPHVDMTCTAVGVVVNVLFRVMVPDLIRSWLAEYFWVSSNLIPVCIVELLPVVETHLLGTRYTLKPAMFDWRMPHLLYGRICVPTIGGYEPSQLMRYQTSHPTVSTLPKNTHPP